MPASTLRAVEIAMRIEASLLSPALCGVSAMLGSANSGWSSGRRLLIEHIEGGAGDGEAWALAAPRRQAGYQHPGRSGILWQGGS
jgi:hypothetical protein